MRIRNSKRVLAVATVTALLSGVGVAAFAVDDAKEVREADFITAFSDTRATGHREFLEEGLHIWTEGSTSTDKVAEYFAPRGNNTELPSSYVQEWYGTDAAPGRQIRFDTDDDDTNQSADPNILVGETTYGDDWWYPGGTGRASTNGVTCPQTDGGSGSDCHGTLAEWDTENPDLRVLALGFSLGSGVKGDGVLRNQTVSYADATTDEYIFTDEEETAAAVEEEQHTRDRDVTATGSWNNANRVARFTMSSSDIPADDTGRGDKVKWEIFVGGTRVYVSNNGWDDTTTWTWKFSTAGGSQKVEVKRNGSSYKTSYITTR